MRAVHLPAARLPHGDVVEPRGRVSDYLRGKRVLVTGGTGFIGKVVVERLLRHAPAIGRIALLIRPRRDPRAPALSARDRFETEVLGSQAFVTLARTHGPRWAAWTRDRLVPVEGDTSLPRLGLDDRDYADLTSTTDIVINAAASVTFDAELDYAFAQNVRSLEHVAACARACRGASLVHISTAFVAGRRTGRFMEAPLTGLDPNEESRAIADTVAAIRHDAAREPGGDRAVSSRLVDAGMERARRLGWHDTYSYTKALGEMTLAAHRDDVPTAILRPTIVESCLRDPSPGWIENLNVGDPLWVEFGRGRLSDFPLKRDAVLDMVPADFVANALLALLPHLPDAADVRYYTVGSGSLNPLSGVGIHDFTHEYFTRDPMHDRRGLPIPPSCLSFPTIEDFRVALLAGGGPGPRTKRLLYLADLYETYINTACLFDTTNTQRLLDDLDDDERAALDFDVRRIDWRRYLQEVHLPGLRRHVLR